jgi:hypothetical protein
LPFPRPNPSNQTGQRSRSASDLRSNSFAFRRVDETESRSDDALRFDFVKRSPGLAKKLPPFTVGEAPLPFCDMTANTD